MTTKEASKQDGVLLKTVRRINAMIIQFGDKQGSVPRKARNAVQASILCTIGIALTFTIHSHMTLNSSEPLSPAAQLKYMKQTKMIGLTFFTGVALSCYQVYRAIQYMPQSKLRQIQQKQHQNFLKSIEKANQAKPVS